MTRTINFGKASIYVDTRGIQLYFASSPLGKRLQPILARKYLELKRDGRESEWGACLESIGAKIVEGDRSEAEECGEIVVVCDPSTPGALTMEVPKETALRILVLGDLP